MYRFIDQSPDRLAGASHFLWWAMRGWVISIQRNRCPAASLASSFVRMRMHEVLSDFNELMLTLNHRGQRRMSFGDHDYPTITEIEAIMMALWVDIAENELERARAVLTLIVLETKVDYMMARLSRVIAHMASIEFLPSRALQPSNHRDVD